MAKPDHEQMRALVRQDARRAVVLGIWWMNRLVPTATQADGSDGIDRDDALQDIQNICVQLDRHAACGIHKALDLPGINDRIRAPAEATGALELARNWWDAHATPEQKAWWATMSAASASPATNG
ncbi:MAG: hypothetical protein AB7K09_20940 [Planctomycetota bacterium]